MFVLYSSRLGCTKSISSPRRSFSLLCHSMVNPSFSCTDCSDI